MLRYSLLFLSSCVKATSLFAFVFAIIQGAGGTPDFWASQGVTPEVEKL